MIGLFLNQCMQYSYHIPEDQSKKYHKPLKGYIFDDNKDISDFE